MTLKGFFITKTTKQHFVISLFYERKCVLSARNECLEFSLHNGNITMDVMKIVGKKFKVYKIDTFIGSVKKLNFYEKMSQKN